MAAGDAVRVQDAYNAAVAGDIEPLVALFDPDLDWQGLRRGHLWWRERPS